MTTTAIISGLIILCIIYVILNRHKSKFRNQSEHQELINKIHSRIAKANGASIEQFSLEHHPAEAKREERDRIYSNADFINKNCTRLEDFIINEKINAFDLRKLADLNGIDLQISESWYPLTLELIRELHENGWDKKVSCIKEKYAELKFYTSGNDNYVMEEIIEKYEKKSKQTCETCGAKGKVRWNSGWDYVACRKHYLENRGRISAEPTGFIHNGTSYLWKEVKNIYLEDFSSDQKTFDFLRIEFYGKKIKHQGWTDDKLHVPKNRIGFGSFLQFLSMQPNDGPSYYSGLNRDYLHGFLQPEFCEICGYRSVYIGECECCENTTWEKDNANGKYLNNEEKKHTHIKLYQIWWIEDEGETYEQQQKNYPKNPEHRWLFTEEEYKKYTQEE